MKKSDVGTVKSVIRLIKNLRESIRKSRNMDKIDYRKKLDTWKKNKEGLIKSLNSVKHELK